MIAKYVLIEEYNIKNWNYVAKVMVYLGNFVNTPNNHCLFEDYLLPDYVLWKCFIFMILLLTFGALFYFNLHSYKYLFLFDKVQL